MSVVFIETVLYYLEFSFFVSSFEKLLVLIKEENDELDTVSSVEFSNDCIAY